MCAKENGEGFKKCPFCLVRYCGDGCRDTDLQRHKLLYKCMRRDMPLVAAEVTEGMCSQVAEEEAMSISEKRMELVACGELAVAAADIVDEYSAEVAKEQATSIAEKRIEYLTVGYSFRCMCCGFDGKTYQ